MKRLLIAALLLTGTLSTSFGQSSPDPNAELYRKLAKSLRYPAAASVENKVAKAYVLFNVNGLGKIADVSVLNATSVDMTFVNEITRAMRDLPGQSLLAGNYVLPIEFQLEGRNKTIKPVEESQSFVQFVSGPKLLELMTVVGYGKS